MNINKITTLKKDIAKLKLKLTNKKIRKGGVWENYGQDEIRSLKDKYSYHSLNQYDDTEKELMILIDNFKEYVSNDCSL